jgi:uncharacterized repeat protein (TIGR01451 family)
MRHISEHSSQVTARGNIDLRRKEVLMLHRTARIVAHLTMLVLLFASLIVPASAASRVGGADVAGSPAATAATGGVLSIPFSQLSPKPDGSCSEYADGLALPFADGGGATGTVYLKHNASLLFACMKAKPGTFAKRFGSLYLDPQGDGAGYVYAQQNDYAMHVDIPGTTKSSFNGTGVANGYVSNAGIAPFWDGASTTNSQTETVEWAVSMGRFGVQPCQVFGLAVYHHWFAAVGDDYGWPSNRYFDQPRTWQLARMDNGATCGQGQNGRIAYIFRGNTVDATSFYNLLVSNGYSVDLIPLSNVLTTVFRSPAGAPNYDLIIVADDTGDLNQWGSVSPPPDISADQVNHIRDANLPIIGLGEGGYAFFGKLPLFIGWPNGWHGPEDRVNKAGGAPPSYYNGIGVDPVPVYVNPVNTVGIYLNPVPLPSDVFPIGLENPTKDHASIIQQGCRLLWGFSGNPTVMVATGKQLFLNAVAYMRVFQCQPEQPPPVACTVSKSAQPAAGTPVTPGQIIKYTINYTNCKQETVKLADTIPFDTIYVPGSASDGIAPGADGSLIWTIPAAPGAGSSGSKTFKVRVSDTQCHNQRTVVNRAGLLISGSLPVISNVVTHPVICPPISMPNDQPPYAEQEVQIDPYPMVTGTPSTISVRLTNSSASAQPVKVSFQTSPQRFGIGITFSTFDTHVVTIPAHGNLIVVSTFTPVSSGHYCIQIKIEDASPNPKYAPIYTQRNLDVNEDLKPGVKDDLVFKVANPTVATANINLVVINTCPGWTATVSPAILSAVGPNGSDVRTATLSVTPPNPVTLGSGCHIDVQGWIGDQLIGGIRKLDVPPVHLPNDIDPPWLEPEISFVPNPPRVGQPGKICVELQNPRAVARTVTVEFAVADFGAGIPFTTVAIRSFTLPPNSLATYCADWTPATGGTLHRCVLVTLKQPGYRDMHSQRNVDLVPARGAQLDLLDIPFQVGNPDPLVRHTLQLNPTIYGIDPFWKIKFITDPGDPPPDVLEPGQIINLHLRFEPAAGPVSAFAVAPAAAPADYRFGDVSRVDVAVLLDGEQIGGLTAEVSSPTVFLPLVVR